MVPRDEEQSRPLLAPRLQGAEELVETAAEEVEKAAVAIGLHHWAIVSVDKVKPENKENDGNSGFIAPGGSIDRN